MRMQLKYKINLANLILQLFHNNRRKQKNQEDTIVTMGENFEAVITSHLPQTNSFVNRRRQKILKAGREKKQRERENNQSLISTLSTNIKTFMLSLVKVHSSTSNYYLHYSPTMKDPRYRRCVHETRALVSPIFEILLEEK